MAAGRPRSLLLGCGSSASRATAAAAASLSPLPLQASRRRAAAAGPVRAASTASSAATTAKPLPTPTSPPDWTVRMLYDGECALCMKEVNFLMKRDSAAPRRRIDFVDIASDGYRADQNVGIDFETAMAKIHAIRPNGEVLTGIAVFRALYEAVGLGWVYSVTSSPPVERVANAVYDFWAKYRTRVTGREDMAEIFEARRRRLQAAEGGEDLLGSECRVDGSGCGADATTEASK